MISNVYLLSEKGNQNLLIIYKSFGYFERKGLITSEEVLEEVSKLIEEMNEKIRRMGREN